MICVQSWGGGGGVGACEIITQRFAKCVRLRFACAVRRSYCGVREQYSCESSNAGAVKIINMVKLQVMVRLNKNGALGRGCCLNLIFLSGCSFSKVRVRFTGAFYCAVNV